MLRLSEFKTFDTIDSAIAHADQLAAELGRNGSTHETRRCSVRVTDEDGKEVYRASLIDRS